MRIYLKYFRKYKLLFITAVCFVFLETLCDLLQPTLMARIIDDGVKSKQVNTIINLGLMMLLVTALGAFFAATRNIIASKVSQGFGSDLREDVFAKIISFSEISADKIESGSLITRMTNDISQATQFINGLMRIFIKAPVTCIGSITLAVLLSPRLSIILFVIVALVAVLIIISMKMSYVRFAKVQYAIDKVNTVVQEYLLGIRLIKAFGRYEDEEEKFDQSNTDLLNKSISSQIVIAYFSPLMTLAVNIGIVAILYFGGKLFDSGEIEVGKVAAYITYMSQILTSLIMITNIFNSLVRTKASTERIHEVLNSEDDFQGFEHPAKQDYGELAFDNVTFAYPNGSGIPALQNLTFEVKRGETLAIIGPTGSGKSTISWLCMRFYEVDQGAVYFNGVDIKQMDSYTLRENLALAPQKSMLFTGTVLENITWSNSDVSQEEIREAARVAQADEFIQNMPDQYESHLGQGGVNLSGGQKQRISIARAMAKKSPILILDDCTSALDSVTEAKVRRGLKALADRITILMITQRVGSAMFADKILVLDNGMKVGLGSHNELLQTCLTYREIYESQMGSNLEGNVYG